MFARKTVFIIGAGCSFEYDLPVGEGLKARIINKMARLAQARSRSASEEPDTLMVDAVRQLAQDDMTTKDKIGPWLTAAEEVARGLPHSSSIDRYIHFRQDDQRIVTLGKLAIVRSILEAEAKSSLYIVPLDHARLFRTAGNQPHWLGQIFERMQENVASKANISDIFKNLTFICFNYDRCIEHYFYNAVRDYGSFSKVEAAEVLNSLCVLHPYGRVGALPWEPDSANTLKVSFGQDLYTSDHLVSLAKGIKTFTEGEHEAKTINAIHQSILDANQIVFMGFSFLEQNMTFLTPKSRSGVGSIFATVFRESTSNQSISEELILSMLKGGNDSGPVNRTPLLYNKTAGNFLSELGNQLRR